MAQWWFLGELLLGFDFMVMEEVKTKVCKRCKRTLPKTREYYCTRNDMKGGFYNYCKECTGHKFIIQYDNLINNTRKCIICGVEYPLDKFHFLRGKRNKRGYDSVCKLCRGWKINFVERPIVVDGNLTCKVCNKVFPAASEYFYTDKNRKTGFYSTCKKCTQKQRYIRYGSYKARSQSDKKGFKICTKCGKELPATTEFFFKSNQGKHRLNGHCKQCIKIYHEAHKKETNERARKYRHDNPEKFQSIAYKLARNMRGIIHSALKHYKMKKKNRTIELVGCDTAFLMNYLESKFEPTMSWNNYGQNGWNIDHVRPCASFDLTDLSQQKLCFHYSNLQPLWATKNYGKNSYYNGKRHFYNKV